MTTTPAPSLPSRLFTAWRVLGATARLTRAVVADDIGYRAVQEPLERRIPDEDHPLRVLFSCPWCIGFWITLAVTVVEHTPLGRTVVWRVLTTALAAHHTATHIASRLGDYEHAGDTMSEDD